MTYILVFLAGALIANALPHLASGVRGEAFPTPFARPPGIGLSSPVVNAIWGCANLAVGALLARRLQSIELRHGGIVFGIGFAVAAIALARYFGGVRQRHSTQPSPISR